MKQPTTPPTASRPAYTQHHKHGFDPFPRLTDWSLALAVGLAFATGLISLVSGRPGDWLIFALHGALGLWIVLLLWGKLRRTLPRLVRPRLWDRRMLIGVAVTALVGLALVSGVWWVFAGDLPLAIFNLLGWHIVLGTGLAALVAAHMLARVRRVWPIRQRALAGRRQALRFGALLAGGLALWPAQQLANHVLRLPGAARRFTGSYEAASYQGNVFPSTSWVADQPRPIAPDDWRLSVGGAVAHPLTLSYSELLTLGAGGVASPSPNQLDHLDALLDCTGGFYSAQHWYGLRVGHLLDLAKPASDVSSIRFISTTGYRWSLPLADARNALLATYLNDEAISDAHGFPLRLVAPGRRGFEWVKWVTRIEALTAPDPGEIIAINTSWLTPIGRGE